MKILSIDPGLKSCGWSLCEFSIDGNLTVLKMGSLETSAKDNFFDRLKMILNQLKLVLINNKVDYLCMESLVYIKNPNSLIKLAQVRGAITSLVLTFFPDVSINEYAPNLVKSSVVGRGHASKIEVQEHLLAELRHHKLSFKSFDESDSLAIALCHILHIKQDNKVRRNSAQRNNTIKSQVFSRKRKNEKNSKSFSQVLAHKIS